MNRNLGMSAGLFALLAVAFHLGSPSPGEKSAKEKPAAVSASKPKPEGVPQPGEPKETSIEGPWLASQYFYGAAATELKFVLDLENPKAILDCIAVPACASDLRKHFGIGEPKKYQFLLATVPDPLHTRLSLFTDSSVQAIQNAASDAGWDFATQWLPWNDHADPEEKDPEERRKQREVIRRQEKQPGLLVFRGVGEKVEGQTLFVFVVGETPTAGINKVQFRLARAYSRLIEDQKNVRLLAPTFSGSFASLADVVRLDTGYAYTVRTGTATNENASQALTRYAADFNGTNENSTEQARHFCDVLQELHVTGSEAALLVEDETSFARGFMNEVCGGQKIPFLRFPRDISHLRNVYRETVAAAQPNQAPAPDVDFSLKDPESGEDSVPIYSSAQTPVLQNAVLSAITSAVNEKHLRLVGLQATNVLDALFLVRILRRQCPDTRVLIPYPDLLFTQAEKSEQWNGTLALSTYPLFPAANEWMHQTARPQFHSDMNAEGVYNAALLLFGETKQLSDYRWANTGHPPTWLLSLDRSGFLPLRVFDEKDEIQKNKDGSLRPKWFQDVKPEDRPSGSFTLPRPPGIWVLVMDLLAAFCMALASWIVYVTLDEEAAWLSWLSMKPISMDERCRVEDQSRQLSLFAFLLLLCGIECLLLVPLRLQDGHFDMSTVGLGLVSAAELFGLAMFLLVRYINFPHHRKAALVFLGLFFSAVGAWFWLCHNLDGDPTGRADFFAYRAIGLRMGSSPAVPIGAAALALLVFTSMQLYRFHLAFNQQPKVPNWSDEMPLAGRLTDSYQYLKRMFRSVLSLHGYYVIGGLGIFVLACLLFRVDAHLRSVDGFVYDTLAGMMQLGVLATLVFTSFQIIVATRKLKDMLVSLNSLPLAGAFTRLELRGGNGSQPIWVRRFHLQALDVPIRAALILHDLELLGGGHSTSVIAHGAHFWRISYRSAVTNLLHPVAEMARSHRRAHYDTLRKTGRMVSNALVEHVLTPGWRERSLLATGAEAESSSFAGNPKDPFDLAQNFVALNYTSFLIYVLRQIQNLLWYLSIGFLLLVISMNAYTFQSPQTIGRFLLFMFLALGCVLWRSLAKLERDPILSRIAGNTPGELNAEFYLRLVGYGALPVLGVLTSQFPSISSFVFSWLQPTLEALH